MNSPLWLSQRTYQAVHSCNACLAKKGRMWAMKLIADEAFIFRDASDRKPPNLMICVENIGQGTYRPKRRFLHSNITTLWLTQNLSHRASSN